jgi:hypothetical protein
LETTLIAAGSTENGEALLDGRWRSFRVRVVSARTSERDRERRRGERDRDARPD